MKILFDTHVLLWMDTNPVKLSPTAAALVCDPANSLILSVASIWEMQIKLLSGKLHLRVPISQLVSDSESTNGTVVIPIRADHVYELRNLPTPHNDPFDRLLACVARVEGATLLTADPIFQRYPIATIW